jgi:hypothetical protein
MFFDRSLCDNIWYILHLYAVTDQTSDLPHYKGNNAHSRVLFYTITAHIYFYNANIGHKQGNYITIIEKHPALEVSFEAFICADLITE